MEVNKVSETTNFKWYVMRAISGKESKVKEYIDAEIKNSDLGQYVAQVLIPTEKVYQIRNGKKITKERNCMPGYILIEAYLIGEISHRLRNTPNDIGTDKMVDLNCFEIEAAMKMVAGTARSMGITVKGTFPSKN